MILYIYTQALELDFEHLDRDKDGVIDFEELLDGVNWDGSSRSRVTIYIYIYIYIYIV